MTTTPTRPKRDPYRWYDSFERAWFAAALVALVIGIDRIPAAPLALLMGLGGVIALVRVVAAIAIVQGGDR